MRGASLFTGLENYSQFVTLKIWSRTGVAFEEIFSVDRTTFADVKTSALRHFNGKISSEHLSTYPPLRSPLIHRTTLTTNDIDNYKLISIESRRTIDEKKKLNEERVKDGGQTH